MVYEINNKKQNSYIILCFCSFIYYFRLPTHAATKEVTQLSLK